MEICANGPTQARVAGPQRAGRIVRAASVQTMDSRTLELFRCLQSGPFDDAGLKQIQRLLGSQRRALAAKNDLGTLQEIIQLLEGWAIASGSRRLSAAAFGEAAEIAERDLRQPSLANELRTRAITAGRQRSDPTIEVPHAEATTEELTAAIARAEAELEENAATANVRALADLYARRGAQGDREQAADLYFTLAEVLGNPAGLELLQLTLSQMPDHAEARALLASYTGRASQVALPRISTTGQAPVDAPKPLANAPAAALVSPPPLGAARSNGAGEAPKSAPRISTPRALGGVPAVPAPIGAPPAPSGARPPNLPVSSLSPIVRSEAPLPELEQASPARRSWRWAVVGLGACAVASGFLLARPSSPHGTAGDQTAHALGAPTAPAEASAAPEVQPAQPAAAQPSDAPAAKPSETPQPKAAAAAADSAPSALPPTAAEAQAENPKAPPSEPAAVAATPEATKPDKPAPKVTWLMDQLTVQGGTLNPQQLSAAMDKTQAQLDECYAASLQKKPKLKGKLLLGFTVKPNGRATAFKHLGGNIKDPELIQCSVKTLEAARFPKPRKAAAKVKLPFQYQRS